jgi:hypothetical protein
MRKFVVFTLLLSFAIAANAQKPNLDKLPEKERNEYLLKTAYEAVMKYAPEWYRDYKKPEISSYIATGGEAGKGRLQYYVDYFYDPQKEKMEHPYSISVGIWANTGEVGGLFFGDGLWYLFSSKPKTRSDEKPYYRSYPYK